VTLQLHVHNAILTLHEYSLSINRSKSISADSSNQLQRLESLWTCLSSTKAWLTTFFSLESFPLASYPLISTAIFSQLAHCLVALFRLNTFESPDVPWDRQKVKQELDLKDILKLWIERWEQVPAATGLVTSMMSGEEDDIWSFTREKILAISSWYELKLAAMSTADADKQTRQGLEENGGLNRSMESLQQQTDMDFSTVNLEAFDDTWIGDLLGGGFEFTEPYF
jgi:hypothetical protein